jgi:hypothetical protein
MPYDYLTRTRAGLRAEYREIRNALEAPVGGALAYTVGGTIFGLTGDGVLVSPGCAILGSTASRSATCQLL